MFLLFRDLSRLRRRLRVARPKRRGSLAIRHVDAGSSNGCEHELNATLSPVYDIARYGISFVASPRHADVLLVSGPVTRNMHQPLMTAYASMPEPRMVIGLGDCEVDELNLAANPNIVGPLENLLPVDMRIPGCPPTPQQIIDALLPLLKRPRES